MKWEGHFQDYEIRCKCGCGFIKVVPSFLAKINWLRDTVGSPLTVNSWCRCDDHNKAVGGKSTSSHLVGYAVDLAVPTDYIKYRILIAAGKIWFRGVGVGETFIHLDDDPAKFSNRFWLY